MEDLRRIEVTVAIWVDDEADVNEVIHDMDYEFTHSRIVKTEVVDANTEL